MKNCSAVLTDELIDRRPIDQPVQRGDHSDAFAGGVVGRTVQRVGEKPLRTLRLRDHLIQLGDLLTHGRSG